jgi:hypothetical protein
MTDFVILGMGSRKAALDDPRNTQAKGREYGLEKEQNAGASRTNHL